MIDRDDWDAGPPEVAAPVPAKEQSIERPDWADGVVVAEPVVAKEQARPDWDETQVVPVAQPVAQPEPAQPEAEVAAPVDTMMAELAEEHDLSIAHEAVEAMAIPDRAGFEAGFDNLPAGAQKAIVGELAQPGEYEGLADDDELANFASTPEGEELVALWGDDADSNLAIVQARLSRIEANTSPAAIETMWAWFDALPSAQAKVVLQALSE